MAVNEAKVSGKALAEKAGLAQSTVSEVLRGRTRPSLEILDALVTHYGFSAHWLLTGRGPVRPAAGRVESDREGPPTDEEIELMERAMRESARRLKADADRFYIGRVYSIRYSEYEQLENLLIDILEKGAGTTIGSTILGYFKGKLASLEILEAERRENRSA